MQRCFSKYSHWGLFPLFVELLPVRIDILLGYVMRWLGGIVRHNVPVPLHHIS